MSRPFDDILMGRSPQRPQVTGTRQFALPMPVVPGNITLSNRPRVQNPDGSISTVRSMSFDQGGFTILVPTVSEDGRIMSNDEAIQQFRRTGRHLGKFLNDSDATEFSKALSRDFDKGRIPGFPAR